MRRPEIALVIWTWRLDSLPRACLPGQTGLQWSVSGLAVRPDRNNFASPRIGSPGNPKSKWCEDGHGITTTWPIRHDDPELCVSTPFANTGRIHRRHRPDCRDPATFTNGSPRPGNTVTNNFAVIRTIAGYVQVWESRRARGIAGGVVLNVGYNGAKGTGWIPSAARRLRQSTVPSTES